MKKTNIILLTALTAALSCSKVVSRDVPVAVPGPAEGIRITEVTGVLDEATRSAYELDTDGNGQPVIHTYWLKGDRIAVTDGQSQSTYQTGSNSSSAETAASFTGDGVFSQENGLWAVYPSTSLISLSSGRMIVNVHESVSQDEEGKFKQWGINDLKVGYGEASGASNVPSIRFRNVLATLRVNLKLAANHGIDFGQNETVKSVSVSAVGNENLAGDFSLALSPGTADLTPYHPVSEIVCSMQEDVELSEDYATSIFFHIAPGAYTTLLVTVRTSIRTIQRAVTVNTTLRRNYFYDINLTKIKNASPYTIVKDIPVPEGGLGDSNSTKVKSAGAVVALWGGVYDETLIGRYYTVQLATDSGFTNIVETTNIQITYSGLYTDETYLDDGQITFCGLNPNTRYYYRAKVMGVGDEYYSSPSTFITTARGTASSTGCTYYIDFDAIKCYGTGDFMNRAVGTYPGAVPLEISDEADWNDRLGFVSSSDNYSYWHGQSNPAASYKVGSSYGEMLIGSSGNPNSAITYSSGSTVNAGSATNIVKAYNRPGYLQLGTTSAAGSFNVSVGTVSLAKNKTTSATVRFKACAFNSTGNTQDAVVSINLYAKSSARVSPCEITGTTNVTIPYNSAYTWQEFTTTVTTNKTTDGTDAGSLSVKYDYPRVLTISTAANGNGKYVRVFIDDIKITM